MPPPPGQTRWRHPNTCSAGPEKVAPVVFCEQHRWDNGACAGGWKPGPYAVPPPCLPGTRSCLLYPCPLPCLVHPSLLFCPLRVPGCGGRHGHSGSLVASEVATFEGCSPLDQASQCSCCVSAPPRLDMGQPCAPSRLQGT
nr:uncharacterized protein LOC123286442 isoform X2 [Equus asinus]